MRITKGMIAAASLAAVLAFPATGIGAPRHAAQSARGCAAAQAARRGAGPPAPVLGPAAAQAVVASDLHGLQAAGFALTDAGRAIVGGENPQNVAAGGTVMLAHGDGRPIPPDASSQDAGGQRALQSTSRAASSATVYFFCTYGAPANIVYWTGATPETFVTFVEANLIGSQSVHLTNPLSCSVFQAPCLFYAYDDPPWYRQVLWATVHAYYTTLGIREKWCSF